MDLMVLADALLLPDDDLALATVLKSPLFGLDDDDLFEIAWRAQGLAARGLAEQAHRRNRVSRRRRPSSTAWPNGRDGTRRSPSMRACWEPEGGRRRFLARLGHEADDALDEFLNLALDYERRETPSLQGFIAWLRAAQTDVKRDMEITRDEVRVMTVHGAKGLEAPIVILADTTTPPAGPPQRQPRLVDAGGRRRTARHSRSPGLDPRKGDRRRSDRRGARARPPRGRGRVSAAALCRHDARHRPARRMRRRRRARAARGLLVGAGVRRPAAGLGRGARRRRDGKVWRYRELPRRRRQSEATKASTAPRPHDDVPSWLDRDAPAEAADGAAAVALAAPTTRRRLVRTSRRRQRRRARQGDGARRPDAPAAAVAARHSPAARAEAARRHLARRAGAFSAEEREAMLEQVRAAARRSALRRAVPAGKPRRGTDRRAPRHQGRSHRRVRPGRPPRRDRPIRC